MQAAMDKDAQKRMILDEGLWKVMVKVSWPAVVAMVLYGLNSVLDAVFVGWFVGEAALAGVSVSYPLAQLGISLGSLVGVGGGAALSIALGAGDLRIQERLVGNVNALCLIFAAAFTAVCLPFAGDLVAMMGGSGDALAPGTSYFSITVLGSVFWIAGLAYNMVVRAEGKMKSAAAMMGGVLALNAVFNYVLMGPLGMGVAGAAWGTNLAMAVYTIVGLVYFKSGRASFSVGSLRPRLDGDVVKSILGLGMSSLIMAVMSSLQGFLVFNALAKHGTTSDVAFFGAVYRIFTFLLTPVFGLMRALQPVAGINYGAGRYDRAISSYKVFAFAAAALSLPAWIVIMIAPGAVLSLMLPGVAFDHGQLGCFRAYLSILPLLSAVFMAMTFFPSVGKGGPAAFIGLSRQLVFYVPVMLVAPRFLGVPGVYYGSLGIDLAMSAVTVFLVAREFRSLRRRAAEVPEAIRASA